MRQQGILMPIASIPSKYGIGTFGKESYRFVDFLKKSGNKLWQILPLGPTGYGDSPYQSFSTFAGNPYYIDLELLVEEGYLTTAECDSFDFGKDEHYVDYENMYLHRFTILRKAWECAVSKGIEGAPPYREFVESNSYWLEDYALYMAVKNHFGGVCFLEWEEDIRLRREVALQKYREELAEEVAFFRFQQYLFAKQWKALKKYANSQGVEIIGDIPIYVAFDSADTWAHPKLFQLDEAGMPIGVAGCPPDAFSETGQLWGNPLYDWEYHRQTGYEWWMQRIAYCYELYDVVRIDHFRGFDEYWFVPYGDDTARNGCWKKGPGYELFATMKEKLGEKKVIAEDLGFLTDSVKELVKKTGYPGMKVLHFAFEAWKNNEYLPHNYDKNCVVYTGTHDNDTTVGFIKTMPGKDKEFDQRYFGRRNSRDLNRLIVRAALASAADTAIIPMQDYLNLGREARINIPSTLGNNWKWRMDKDALNDKLAEEIAEMAKLYGRL